MLPHDIPRLRAHYHNLPDQELESQVRHGPSGFASPEIWQIVSQEAERRGIPIPASSPTEVEPEAPGVFEAQPSSLAGCLSVAKMGLVAVGVLNLAGLVIVIVSGDYGDSWFWSLLKNLFVLGFMWLAVSYVHTRVVRRARKKQPAASSEGAA
jgi:hypothetical protein